MNTLYLLATMLLLSASAIAQSALSFDRVNLNAWPLVEAEFTLMCDLSGVAPSSFRVYEDGIEITNYAFDMQSNIVRSKSSALLLLDASASMAGAANAEAKSAGNAFVAGMDTVVGDTVGVMWCAASATLQQGWTGTRAPLRSAVDALPASGTSALWDGVYAALQETATHGTNPCKFLVVVTNGVDNASTHTVAECIAYANQQRIRIYTIGVGNGIQETDIKSLADNCGGRYYAHPSSGIMQGLFTDACTIVLPFVPHAFARYNARCADGSARSITITTTAACTATQRSVSKSYTAPRDTSSFLHPRIGFADTAVRGNAEVHVPLQLRDALPVGSIIQPGSVTVAFDTSRLHFLRAETPAASLWAGRTLKATQLAGGVSLRCDSLRVIDTSMQSGMLADIVFRAADVAGKDTIAVPVAPSGWVFDKGCLNPLSESGTVRIAPRAPDMTLTVDLPDSVVWVRALKDYNPSPIVITVTLQNNGDAAAKNARCRIIYSKTDFTASPTQHDTIYATPSDIAPSSSTEMRWELSPKRRLVGDSLTICVEAMFDNASGHYHCYRLWIPPADAVLACTLTAPEIKADRVNQRYVPMPFDVTVTVRNEGGKKTDSVYARITVPKDLKLYGPDASDRNNKRVLPSILNPGQQGNVSWTLWHPITLTEKTYTIKVCVRTSNADSTCCEMVLIIPPIEAPVLSPQCSVPDTLRYNAASNSYTPNPFEVRLSCVNKGGLPATNTTGYLYLPADVVLADSGDVLRKAFPSPLTEWRAGDSVPFVSWKLRSTKMTRAPRDLEIRFMVGGLGPTGLPTDSIETICRVHVPGLPSAWVCELLPPDSVGLNAARTELSPNPFEIGYQLRNISAHDAYVDRIELVWDPTDELTLEAITPQVLPLGWTISPGDTVRSVWRMRAKPRSSARKPQLCAKAYDEVGLSAECCDSVPIAGLSTIITCDVNTSETRLRYDTALHGYQTRQWVVTATLTNSGMLALSGASAEVLLNDSSMTALLELDPTFPDNANPKSFPAIFPNSSKSFQWGFRLKQENRSGRTLYPAFRIRYTAAGQRVVASGCIAQMIVDTVPGARLVANCSAPDTLRLDPVTGALAPDPFNVSVTCANKGAISAKTVQAWLALPPGIMLANAGETIGKMFSPSTLGPDTGAPPPKITWSLRTARNFPLDTCLTISMDIAGVDSIVSGRMPQTRGSCTICVQGSEPRFDCHIDCIDSLLLNAKGDDVLPNPFPVRYRIANTGHVRGGLALAELFLPSGQGLSFDPSTPASQPIAKALAPGDTATVTWLVRVANSLLPRKVSVVAVAYDSAGTPMSCPCNTGIAAVTILNGLAGARAPEGFVLHQNTPNPFSTTATLSYGIPYAMHVQLSVHDALGREVALLVSGEKGGGMHSALFDASRLPNGSYLYKLEAGGVVLTRLLTVMK